MINLKNLAKKIYQKKLPAFTIMEVGITLLIIAILSFGTLKGFGLVEKAKQQSTIQDIYHFLQMIQEYKTRYHYFPGDDPIASKRFGQTENGKGSDNLSDINTPLIWQHLHLAGITKANQSINPSMGGQLKLATFSSLRVGNDTIKGGQFIVFCGNNGEAILSPKQCLDLKNQIDGSNHTITEGSFFAIEDEKNTSSDRCIKDGAFNIKNDTKSCVGLFRID
jgi:type II secretory pathway pseudopilin PulG